MKLNISWDKNMLWMMILSIKSNFYILECSGNVWMTLKHIMCISLKSKNKWSRHARMGNNKHQDEKFKFNKFSTWRKIYLTTTELPVVIKEINSKNKTRSYLVNSTLLQKLWLLLETRGNELRDPSAVCVCVLHLHSPHIMRTHTAEVRRRRRRRHHTMFF